MNEESKHNRVQKHQAFKRNPRGHALI